MLRRLFYPLIVLVALTLSTSLNCFAPPGGPPPMNGPNGPIGGGSIDEGIFLLALAGSAMIGFKTVAKRATK